MMPKPTLSEAHFIESIAGEEDPGASLDVVRDLVAARKGRATASGKVRSVPARQPTPQIHMDCEEADEIIHVDVGWPAGSAHARHSAADLLGLVVAHHSAIANTAWSRFNSTGQRRVAVEVDENEDGVFYVSLKDA